jgi:hypothetical protein
MLRRPAAAPPSKTRGNGGGGGGEEEGSAKGARKNPRRRRRPSSGGGVSRIAASLLALVALVVVVFALVGSLAPRHPRGGGGARREEERAAGGGGGGGDAPAAEEQVVDSELSSAAEPSRSLNVTAAAAAEAAASRTDHSPPAGEGEEDDGRTRFFFVVKTTEANLPTRLRSLASTWIRAALAGGHRVVAVSDGAPAAGDSQSLGFPVHSTDCGAGHTLGALCCKLGHQIRLYCRDAAALAGGGGGYWWCAIDDDCYVRTDRLRSALEGYGRRGAYYVGAPFVHPFAPGGAGYCLSPPAMTRLCADPAVATPRSYVDYCRRHNRWDDESLGLFLAPSLGMNLTAISGMTSHLDLNWLRLLRELKMRLHDPHLTSQYLDRLVTASGSTDAEMRALHCLFSGTGGTAAAASNRSCRLPSSDYCGSPLYAHVTDKEYCRQEGLTVTLR